MLNAVRDNSLNCCKAFTYHLKMVHSFMQKETPINLNVEKKNDLCLFFRGEFQSRKKRSVHTQKQIITRVFRCHTHRHHHHSQRQLQYKISTTLPNFKYIFLFSFLSFQCKQIDDKHFKKTEQKNSIPNGANVLKGV